MQNKLFLKAADICELLEVKQTSAYEIIGNLNKELKEQGYLMLRGKVPTKYFVKRFYGVEDTCEIPQEEGRNGFMRKRKMYLSVEDIAELFGLSVSFAYRVVERMNADLASKNYYVILGRVTTRYVEDKIYGLEHVEQYLKEDKAV